MLAAAGSEGFEIIMKKAGKGNCRLHIIGTLNRSGPKFANKLEVKLRRGSNAKVVKGIGLGVAKEILGSHAANYSGWCNHVGP